MVNYGHPCVCLKSHHILPRFFPRWLRAELNQNLPFGIRTWARFETSKICESFLGTCVPSVTITASVIRWRSSKARHPNLATFRSKPNMKVHVQNLRVSFLKREAQNCLFSSVFATISPIFSKRGIGKRTQLVFNCDGPYICPKFANFDTQMANTYCGVGWPSDCDCLRCYASS